MKQPNPVNTVASQPSMDAGTIHHGQMVHGRYQGGVSPALQSRTQQTPENNSGVNLGASPRQQDPLLSQQNNHKRARTGNTVGPFNSQPSTPLTHTPNEGVAITGDMPKGPVMYGSDAIGGLASSANQPMCDDMEAFEDLEDLEDKAEWFLPQVDGNLQQSDMESFGALEDVDIESVVTAINWNPSEFIERQQAKEQEQMKQPNPMNTETSQPHMDHGEMVDGNHQGGSVLASLQQLNPRTQQTPFEAGDGESRKGICNCEKSKCLQLFCECFAAGVYCSTEPPCSCINCHNIPIYKEDVLNSRKKIESRNPLAFAPKIISRSSDPVQETRDDASKTPASGHHRRGCNCKKSKCSNKNCECFQGGVCCSTRCRCIECGNKNQERK
ncbi:uncharacterized protein LOC108847556 [Raphanus sativus]|uniref:Uncharacterized protein LOC108847556 n=1 Tax=Raphanus sativus TaxID=3726 RepID=A0A6J0MW07_RAPSA|nr:uncharacterized protein LOC108847556 [Raphanus sativus]XP_018476326.1 uncharacterized protein LOC108847556 [Raphanus sativus]XP_018476327.1 uncharacterized protein LOC108847556 [Raphanus sativus]